MFDGMPDQFYQFLAATSRATNTTTATPPAVAAPAPALSFSLLHANFQQQPSFDASYLLHHHHHHLPLHLQQQQQVVTRNVVDDGGGKEEPVSAPWSNEEVLTLLKIRSTMDNPWLLADFTWENVSRKLAEAGFKRSAEKCKEKFEEETRSFNSCSNNNNSNNDSNIVISNKNDIISQNYRLFGELEELYNGNTTTANGDHCKDQELDDPRPSLSRKNQSPRRDHEDGVVEVEVEKGRGQETSGNNDSDETGARDRDNSMEEDGDGDGDEGEQQSVDDSEKTTEENTKKVVRKRKRQKKFEMFKGFCEKIVNKMMAQQEELHCKILQDMVKRDQEKIAREEAWKKEEIDRITQEMEVRAHEQAIVGDRQAKILGFLKKFSSLSNNLENQHCFGDQTLGINVAIKVPKITNHSLSNTSSSILSQDSISVSATHLTSSCATTQQKSNLPTSQSKDDLAPQSPNRLENPKSGLPISSSSLDKSSQNPNPVTVTSQSDLFRLASASTPKSFSSDHTSTDATGQVPKFKPPVNPYMDSKLIRVGDVKDDTGRRWPRDEVLALINIRCSLFNTNGDPHDRESFSKGPLWERISQKMMELGYKRSAKRCKEKWENINKYFRKTKDMNKKRSMDSRTCPYFHQLAHLYNQEPLHGHPDRPAISPDNQSMPCSGGQGGSSATSNGATNTTVLTTQGNEGTTVVQVSAGFGFEF